MIRQEQIRRLVPADAAAAVRRRSTIRRRKQLQLIETCYSTHHLQFDNDPDETVYFNELSGPIFGWIDTKVLRRDHGGQRKTSAKRNRQQSAGAVRSSTPTATARSRDRGTRPRGRGGDRCSTQSDTAGGGAAPAAAAGQRAGGAADVARGSCAYDPKLDTMVSFNLYSVIPSPVDDSVWGVARTHSRAMLVRLQRGNNPPESCKTQIFKVPEPGFDPRGVDVDSNGVVWTALAASSHLASFDVRKCKDLTAPQRPTAASARKAGRCIKPTVRS